LKPVPATAPGQGSIFRAGSDSLGIVRRFRVVLFLVLIGGVGFVIDRQLAGKLHPDGTTLVLVVITLALVLGLVFPRQFEQFIERMTSLKVGGFELGLREVERSSVVERLPEAEEYGTQPIPPLKPTGTTEGDLDEVRVCLVSRLGLTPDPPGSGHRRRPFVRGGSQADQGPRRKVSHRRREARTLAWIHRCAAGFCPGVSLK